ncbi:hypothetical protein [Pseudomonas syringae group genomosp. 3]|uniref:Conjugal transfer protein n=1 Tax=Pseudomonas syringae pv. coriandricola TaxID=264453 RepID=A0A3M3JLN9_9PSED|nr:Conjugal transfer protein [Pseudomonas syringae pv. coriandricola]
MFWNIPIMPMVGLLMGGLVFGVAVTFLLSWVWGLVRCRPVPDCPHRLEGRGPDRSSVFAPHPLCAAAALAEPQLWQTVVADPF